MDKKPKIREGLCLGRSLARERFCAYLCGHLQALVQNQECLLDFLNKKG